MTDSGLAYCRTHHGVVEWDGGDGPCDNASLYRTECDLTPLVYDERPNPSASPDQEDET
jgi:hypothetical protein